MATKHPQNESRHIRVLFVSRKWPPAIGGMETYSLELTTALTSKVDLTRIVLSGRKNGHPPPLARMLLFILSTALRIWRERNNYDVYHFGDFALFPLAWLTRKLSDDSRIVITVHGLDILYGNRSGYKPALYRHFIAWASRQQCVDHFIANSGNTAMICRRMGFEPVDGIPLGVRPGLCLEAAESDERFLLFVGRLVPRKGASWFAENVLPQLPKDVLLFVVGKPWDKAETETLQQNKRVRLHGYLPDQELEALKCRCIAMVMPNIPSPNETDVEGFGIVAVEAGSQGIPLIAADIEGLHDAVRHGETGFLLPSGDARAWQKQIEILMNWGESERRKFAVGASDAVAKHYSWDRVAEDTLEIYRMTTATDNCEGDI